MTNLAKSFRAKLHALAKVEAPRVITEKISGDGTRKWLFDVGGGNAVESVFIPEDDRGTLCISTQAGCAMGCLFCSTGKQGFNRNLSTAEIVGQLWHAERELREAAGVTDPNDRIISNVVLMGMGEPLQNLENVIRALKLFGLQSPLPTVGTAFGCILVFALLRGVLRYAEQASNHYIAFRLLALIRDKVFGALRRLTPAKLEGRKET